VTTNERCDEVTLAEAVRAWVDRMVPGDRGAADAAVAAAVRAYASGASLPKACEEAHRLARSWSRHPSRPVARSHQWVSMN
jgi:hypothetical protein